MPQFYLAGTMMIFGNIQVQTRAVRLILVGPRTETFLTFWLTTTRLLGRLARRRGGIASEDPCADSSQY